MRAILTTLFAAGATAEITTSFWMPPGANIWGTDRITYVASVVAADKDRTTLAIHLSDDPDYEALAVNTANTQTYVVAPTLFEISSSELPLATAGATPGEFASSLRCEIQTSSDEAAFCTASAGPGMRRGQCSIRSIARPAETHTREWTFSDPGTQGVETIVRTFPAFPARPSTALPDWCSAISDGKGPVPSSILTANFDFARSELETFALIITAGEEKLPATTGEAITTSTAEATGSESSSGTPAQATGAVAPLKTMAPALAGLGAAVAIFL